MKIDANSRDFIHNFYTELMITNGNFNIFCCIKCLKSISRIETLSFPLSVICLTKNFVGIIWFSPIEIHLKEKKRTKQKKIHTQRNFICEMQYLMQTEEDEQHLKDIIISHRIINIIVHHSFIYHIMAFKILLNKHIYNVISHSISHSLFQLFIHSLIAFIAFILCSC